MLDCKCVQPLAGGGCWYCEFNSEICMRPYSPGFVIQLLKDDPTTFKFCGNDFQDLFCHHPLVKSILPVQTEQSVSLNNADNAVFLQNCTVTRKLVDGRESSEFKLYSCH